MSFDSNMPVNFNARSKSPPYCDATILVAYRGSLNESPPATVAIDKVFRCGSWTELSPEWWSIDYMGSEANVHRLRLAFFGDAFSTALSNGSSQAIELDQAFRDYATIVIDLNLAPHFCDNEGNPRDIAALHLKLV